MQATKTNWNLDNGMGGMISVGIGGSITGYGADLLIVDDPIKNRAEAESATYRDKLWDEYQSTVSTRLHAGGAVIIILTRWHEDDLAARLLNPEYGKVEDWDIISLPAVCEDPATDPLGRELGEALWPAGGYDEAASIRSATFFAAISSASSLLTSLEAADAAVLVLEAVLDAAPPQPVSTPAHRATINS